jgi:hypothetical protein
VYDSFWRSGTYTQVKQLDGRQDGLTMGLTTSGAADARMGQRISFDYYFALIFIAALHGFSSLKVISILYANYTIATGVPKRYMPAATWAFNIGILFANELSRGYPYARLFSALLPIGKDTEILTWGTWLDSHGGLIPRWEVLFNLTVLRLISFNLDYYWSLNMRGGSPIEVSLWSSAHSCISYMSLTRQRRNNSTHLI